MFRTLLVTLGLLISVSPLAAYGNDEAVKTCAAVRGNGDRILAHFGAIGRYHDSYPAFDGIAGGSSGSITSFIYESMQLNPLLEQCEGRSCSREEKRQRLAFLVKSIMGYVDAYKNTEEVQALLFTIQAVKDLQTLVAEPSFQKLITYDAAAAAQKVLAVLRTPEFRGLINPDLITLFQDSQNIPFHLEELQRNLKNFGSWKAADTSIFFFPGFINWPELGRRMGRIADFYAGYGSYYPLRDMDAVLQQCAPALAGKDWNHSEVLACQKDFTALIADYRKANIADVAGPHRIQDPIGKGMMALASTSILMGAANVAIYKAAHESYRRGEAYEFKPQFSDIKMGYFGREADLARIQENERGYTDTRTQRFESLGTRSWQDIISVSPAEPSLSDIRPVDEGRYSIGGWIDLSPTLVLRNAGCDEVVYFTRYVDRNISGFAASIVKMLNASDEELEQIIGANPDVSPTPAFILSNNEATGVWCTDWDAPAMGDFNAQFRAGLDGIFYSDSYPNAVAKFGVNACVRD
ncbi:MAG TPA: hypothetical protein VFO10_30405 [Oligoflexus sp.]|uniref:hypothetical protein n=1 Tax=Oligoflexus sp. TaxID=1971216 RepID=UPI002D7E8882|nr:hypothetical protein [Oligoflexus sp.]HET9241618.1 hypothetical protein [Oligoflexus sp.]